MDYGGCLGIKIKADSPPSIFLNQDKRSNLIVLLEQCHESNLWPVGRRWGWGGLRAEEVKKEKTERLGQRFILETQNKEKAQKVWWQKGSSQCFPALVVEASVPMTKFKMLSKAW